MGIKFKKCLTLAAAVPLALAGAAPAVADNVMTNKVVVEVISTGTVSTIDYYISQTGGDGEAQCNATVASPAVLTPRAYAADGLTPITDVTFSPTSVTLSECGPHTARTVKATSTKTTPYVVKVTVADSGPGSYNSTDVAIAPPNQAPVVSVTEVTAGAEYVAGSVPTPGCSVTDDQAVAAQPAPVVSPAPFDALGAHTVTCSYTDAGGKSGSGSLTYTVVQPPNNAPTVAVTGVTKPEYPAATPPAVGCDADDADGPIADPSPTFTGSLNDRGIGERTATCSVTDDRGETATDSKSYRLVNTPPTVEVTGPTTASYVNGTQPAASAFGCEVTDADETGLSSTPDVDTSALVRGLGDVTVTCDAEDTDRAAAERDSFTYTITNSAPSVAVTGVDRASYEIGSEPTVGCAVTDLEDGASTGTAQVARGALSHGLGTVTVTCDATDTDGAAADQSRVTYSVVDTGKPTISGERTTPANAFGWSNGPVGVAFTCADAGGSGIASCTPATATVSTEGAGQSVTGTATDFGGNTATATVGGIDIDLTKPNVAALPGTTDKPVVTDGGSYTSGSVPAAPTCLASDALSGLAGACTVSPVVDKVGAQTLTLSATDKAGNTRTVTIAYTVKRKVTGFYSPVDLGGVVNTVKAGSSVPLKFEVFDGGVEETSTAVVKGGSVTAAQVGCTSTTSDDIEVLSPGATALRYDATGGQFIQNWQTPKVVGACYRVTMTTVDGATSVAMFKTK